MTMTIQMIVKNTYINQLTKRIPNNSPNNIEIGQQDDNNYLDDREEYLYQVDGKTDVHTPTDHSTDGENTNQRIIHIKDRERYMCQLTQIEKN